MKLRTQFLLGVAVLIVVLLTMAIFAVVTRSQVVELRTQHDFATSLQEEANSLAYLSSNYLLYQEDAQKERWETVFTAFSRDLQSLEARDSADSAIVATIRVNAGRLREVFDEVAATAAAGERSVTESQVFLRVSWSRLEVQSRQIVFDAARLEDVLEHRVQRANTVSTMTAFALMGLFGLLLLATYVLMYRRTTAGIAVLRAGAERVGCGDLDHLIPAERRDEIGDLSRAFNTMTIDLKSVTASKAELEKEVAERKQAQAETARLLAERSSLFERLQTTLLHVPQELPGIRFSHLYRSATSQAQVGGDFYGIFAARDKRIGLVIGDVCGHGIDAARTATLVKDTVHAFAHQLSSPHEVLRETNQLLVDSSLRGFVTVFLGFLDPESGTLTFSSAGHPPPLLASNGGSLALESIGPPLGVLAAAEYADTQVCLAKGSLLVLYTDGITEVRRRGTFFGEDGLQAALAAVPSMDVQELPTFLLSEALRFSSGRLHDDVALLAVNYLGSTAAV
jgi:serine phosphatase RsbU (regulator of sigma subunit)